MIQRAIANAKGIPNNIPLNVTPHLEAGGGGGEFHHCPSFQVIEHSTKISTDFDEQSKISLQPSEAMDISLQSLANNINSSSPLSSSTTNTSYSSSPTTTTHNQNNNNTKNIEYLPSAGTMTHSAQSGMSSTEEEAVTSDNVHRLWKRKYHRHAKPDSNAPLKPPSAYVMFSNDVRAELKQQNKSFTDLAKIIGDRWKNIAPDDKDAYETNAMRSREEYLKKLEEYHKTDFYKVSFFYFSIVDNFF